MRDTELKYPVGVQDFETLRQGGYIYIDKTELVYPLANKFKSVFLARPRRFGKSLLLTTLKAYFEGKRVLFDGLSITGLEKEWVRHPVLLISLASYNKCDPTSIDALLDNLFQKWEQQYDVQVIANSLAARFHNIIEAAHEQTGQRVVILIDEYDAPMVAHIGDEENHSRARNLLKSIYVNIKDMDAHIRFAMLTGVSRFSRTSVFSGLNNLVDITFDNDFSAICGITEEELASNFKTGIAKLAQNLETDYAGAMKTLKDNYDGYHFTKQLEDIYNPFSLLNALSRSEIGSYWFASGTPTFLMEAIHNTDRFLPRYFTEEASASTLSEIDTFRSDPLALMFQTGYLTIKGYDRDEQLYRMGIPNREVREGLSQGLLKEYMDIMDSEATGAVAEIRRALRGGRPEDAMERIKSFLAGIPYELARGKDEIYFENNLYLLFNLIGIRTKAEYHTARGRIDLLVVMSEYVYVLELKLDGSAEEALTQINAKGYCDPFVSDGRIIFKIGINFSRETRNIDTWIIEKQ